MSNSELVHKLVLQGVPVATAEKFVLFHRENPQIWREFYYATVALLSKGVRHYGAKAIFEHLRYESTVSQGEGAWKLNNDWTALYARLWKIKHPAHGNFFETRSIKAIHADCIHECGF